MSYFVAWINLTRDTWLQFLKILFLDFLCHFIWCNFDVNAMYIFVVSLFIEIFYVFNFWDYFDIIQDNKFQSEKWALTIYSTFNCLFSPNKDWKCLGFKYLNWIRQLSTSTAGSIIFTKNPTPHRTCHNDPTAAIKKENLFIDLEIWMTCIM